MEQILDIQSPVKFDETISHYEIHAHQPYTALNFNNSDEIRIAIQHQDLCLLPSRSLLHIYGRITKTNGENVNNNNTKLVNNAVNHMFEEIRYELNAIEIDRCKNVGLTSTIKGWISSNESQNIVLENAGWTNIEESSDITNDEGYFDICIPLSMILGFAEDYHKIIVNVKHELILTRSRNDLNAVVQQAIMNEQQQPYFEDFKINLIKIEWLMPYVMLSDSTKIKLFKQIDKTIQMSFRSWDMYEYPLLPTTTRHVWTVKTSNQLEKPRFVILAFQTNRKGQRNKNASHFDNCNISNIKLFLNSQYYPYGNLNLNIDQNQFAILYEMFANFQTLYYGKLSEPMINKANFRDHMSLIVIDCSRQNESLKSAPVDVRLEFESRNNFPANTSAYCLILHDRVIEYNPVTGDVKKIV